LIMAIIFPIIIVAATVSVVHAMAQATPRQGIASDAGIFAISAAISVVGSGAAASYALAKAGSAAVSAAVEKPEAFFKAFLVTTLCEAIAIYGVVVAILLWLNI